MSFEIEIQKLRDEVIKWQTYSNTLDISDSRVTASGLYSVLYKVYNVLNEVTDKINQEIERKKDEKS